MTSPARRARGHDAFARRAWAAAYAELEAAHRAEPLDADDLERLATAACLIGRHAESAAAWAEAHHRRLQQGEVTRAVRCAFWLAFGLLLYGERSRAGAWIDRARRLLEGAGDTVVEQGYLLLPLAMQQAGAGRLDAACDTFARAAAIGERFDDDDLIALARHGRGRMLIRCGDIRGGVRVLDEAMVAVDAGEVSPLAAGEVYCSVIEGCLEILDTARAREWTAALARWCQAQPDLLPFSGQCLVRRAEILQLQGAWADAAKAAAEACERLLRGPGQPAAAAAFYQCGELHRLQGDWTAAAEAYREASRRGKTPQPGLALLRLAQGDAAGAASGIRLALDSATHAGARARLLPACVEIMLAADDLTAARDAASALEAIAASFDTPFLHAAAASARGAVQLAEGDGRAALPLLRRAWAAWQDLDAPYEAARVRVRIGLACRSLGDEDAAQLEFDAARWMLQPLGARHDLASVDAIASGPGEPAPPGGLSRREIEVLRLVAAGKTNRTIADELVISERTVERHVSNIFGKLNVSSRAAATAHAYEHKLI